MYFLLRSAFPNIILLLLLLIAASPSAAQEKLYSEGREFLFPYYCLNIVEDDDRLILYITSKTNSSGSVRIVRGNADHNRSITFNLIAGGITEVSIPPQWFITKKEDKK